MPAQFKMFLYFCNHFLRALRTGSSTARTPLLQDLPAGSGKNNDPAVTYRVFGIIKCFLRLIQVDILRISAWGDKNNIRLLFDFHFVNPVQKPAGLPDARQSHPPLRARMIFFVSSSTTFKIKSIFKNLGISSMSARRLFPSIRPAADVSSTIFEWFA